MPTLNKIHAKITAVCSKPVFAHGIDTLGLIIALAATLPAHGAGTDSTMHRRWGLDINVSPGHAIAADSYEKKWLKGRFAMAASVGVRHVALPRDSDAYAAVFGYPVIAANVKYNWNHGVTMHREQDADWGLLQPVDYTSRMGNAVSVYGTFERPFFRHRRWQAGYSLSFGVGYTQSKYNTYDAIDNELIGSRWLIYFGAALHATYHVSRDWGVRAGIDFYHHSNGALNRPNKGANVVAPSVGLVYEPYYEDLLSGGRTTTLPPFKRFTFAELAVSAGAKTLNEDWQRTQFGTPPGAPGYRTSRFKLYAAYSIQASVMRRYARQYASGGGIDVFYATYASRVAEIDRTEHPDQKHSPWSVGLSAKHRVYYHNLSLDMALGFYLHRAMGHNARQVETPYYEHIGLHYSFPSMHHVSIGINVKAHKTKADYTEFQVAIPVRL